MNKPSWANEVHELTEEEALALDALGVTVFVDWEIPVCATWYESPVEQPLSDVMHDDWWVERDTTRFCFLRREGDVA